jgi:ribosome-associated protein
LAITGRTPSPERIRSGRSTASAGRETGAEVDVVHGPHTLARPKPAGPPEVGRRIALLAAAAGLEKKAEDIQIIDVVGKVDYADYIVLMTGASDRNVAAIARGIEGDLAKESIKALALEGLPLGRWVLIDFVEVVVHVFQAEWRQLYDLDGLWMDAARIPVPPAGKSA